ncbi:thioredoxin family protein [Natronococcus sp. A-GB7]|uniref:TlpA family protein disulfide reductase n=1 Tax=Natronococcus sp. A-GB7 TaxID=3037649 RepID=UPI002420009C|nr:thioredoxin family protein [Natronococcus sp. A-GB7]MDG5818994.1 thioredoxin family protein [Natronococcus sp. A-GB7]
MSLETMRPNPTWDAASYEDAVDTLAAHRDELTYRIWGGDWCKDCRALLPDFGAALEAAEIPDERIEEIGLDENKEGPKVDAYDVEYIPTIVVEDDDGEEITRFVEEERVPPAVWIAGQLEQELGTETA